MQIHQATRIHVRPLICLYGESGTGKTYSSLLLARGFVGPAGKVAMIDTETGRGSLYADVLPGGYDVLDLDAPFSPARYIEAIEAIENSGASIGVLDSASHEWEGQGGILDIAADNEEKSGKTGLHNWKAPKFEHAKFMQRLLRAKIPWIVCVRAKYKTRQGKENGRTIIIKDDYTSPIQAEDFIFEMTVHGEVLQDHSFKLTKVSHPTLRTCFPESGPIKIEHGSKLAEWCGMPAQASKTTQDAPKPTPAPKTPDDPLKPLKTELWAILKPYRGRDKTWATAEKILREWKVLGEDQTVSALIAEELAWLIAATKDTIANLTNV